MLQRCTVVTRNVVFVPFFRDHHIYFKNLFGRSVFLCKCKRNATHALHPCQNNSGVCTTVVPHTGVDHLKHRTGIVPHIRYNSSVVIKSAVTFVGSTVVPLVYFVFNATPRFFGKMKPKKNHLMSSPSPPPLLSASPLDRPG